MTNKLEKEIRKKHFEGLLETTRFGEKDLSKWKKEQLLSTMEFIAANHKEQLKQWLEQWSETMEGN